MTFEFQQFRRSLNETLGPLCNVSCNPSNHYGSCLAPCWMLCPSICPDPTPSFYPRPIPSLQKPSKSSNPLHIVIPVLITVCFALFLFFLHARRRSHSTAPPVMTETREGFLDEEHGPVLDHPIWYIRTVGLQASTIDSIAVFKYRKGDGVVDVTDCSVCLSEFQEDEVLRLLPKCTHAFHIACIDTWLRSHTNCPVCRAPVAVTPPRAPSTEVNSGNSSVSGEAHVDTLEENGEQHREIEVAVCEIELNTREGGEGLAVGSGGTEPARRSISIDSSEAYKITRAIALNSSEESPTSDMTSENRSTKGKELGQGSDSRRIGGSQRFLRLVGSSPIGRSLQSGPIFLKRSVTGYPESSLP